MLCVPFLIPCWVHLFSDIVCIESSILGQKVFLKSLNAIYYFKDEEN